MNRNDSVQINILRFPLMVGVIFSHAYSLVSLPGAAVQVSQQQPVAMFIESTVVGLWARLATPLFFLFSGYLLYHGEALNGSVWAAKLKNRVSRLGVPYLCWNGAVFALYFVGQAVPRLQPFFTKPECEIVNLDWWERVNLLLGITRFPIDYQFWFIRDLLLLVAVSPVLWLAMRYVRIPAIALLVLLWSGLLGDVPLPFASRALVFFTLGLALGQISGVSLRIPQHAAYVLAFVLVTVVEAALRTTLRVDRFEDALTLLFKADTFLGICAAWTVAGWMRKYAHIVSVLNYLKQYAFFTFAAHEPLLMTLKKLGYTALGYDTSGKLLTVYFGAAGLTLIACVATGILLRRLLPTVFQVLTVEQHSAAAPSVAAPTAPAFPVPANILAPQASAAATAANLGSRSATAS